MACMSIPVDTSGWTEEEVWKVLDHLGQHNEKHFTAWMKEHIQEMI